MGLNPQAIVFWVFTAGIGYLVEPSLTGAVAGLVTGMGLSLIASIF